MIDTTNQFRSIIRQMFEDLPSHQAERLDVANRCYRRPGRWASSMRWPQRWALRSLYVPEVCCIYHLYIYIDIDIDIDRCR